MTSAAVGEILPTLVGVLLLCGVSAAVLTVAGVRERFGPTLAVLRAAVQLSVIAVILTGVITSPWWVGLALLVMLGVAIGTSVRRLGLTRAHLGAVATAIVGGTVVALAAVFASGALAPTPRYLLAIGGIVVGNAMAITTLSARRFLEAADEHWDEVEGWLALGARPIEATRSLARGAVHTALVPSVDQTRTTGLVTLPGAFVGAIFGGLPPFEAGRFQIVVLAAIVAAGALAATIVVRLLGAIEQRPVRS
ncbi:ABC transporter permease [Amnibacterium kyonggiense]|uniref:Putative ABC transport system permease protein n=1 Tax=Amnibacterium kyonggiense TaxID=595671 RepID=A0A4R7FR34_9MICO|nr:ABC transporter permease [Amnibacterium kyonggiense]TDS80233.1 putative ABC transport system permease protein [Amnibacterium kyonggiense]